MTEEELFRAAIALPTHQRAAFLNQACGTDAALRAAVEALLAAQETLGLHATLDAGVVDGIAATGEHVPAPGDRKGSRPARSGAADDRRDGAAGVVIGGRYTLQEKVGEGGMGEVWVAWQTEPVKRKVALKLIKSGMDSKAVLQRFEQERQALALMDHPNIARVLDGGLTPTGQPYFVMELVDGLPLNRFCDERQLSLRTRLELFAPICQAVQHAHQKGIVHRDLKPANILVAMIDGKPVPKVIDFGVAKATEGKITEETMATGFGNVVGTLEYMSPEQAGYSSDDVDTRADIYSLGVILYEVLTGLRPIDARRLRKAALHEMFRIIQEEEPPRPSTRISTAEGLPSLAALRQTEPRKLTSLLRGELDWVVMKCLEKQRERRYETANALSRDIQRYLADEPVEARPPTAGYRFQKFLRRHKGPVVAVSLVALALIGGMIGTATGYVRAENARVREAQERDKAERLAERNGELARAERQAKEQATRLAKDNAKLANDERAAKIEALEANREKENQLLRTKNVLFTSQLNRATQIQEKEPHGALELLHDTEACPIDLRDMAWNFIEHACKRRVLGSFPVNVGGMHALSPDGKLLASVQTATNPVTRTMTARIVVVEVPSGKLRATLPDFSDSITLLAFDADGGKLAVVADGIPRRPAPNPAGGEEEPPAPLPGKVQVWDVAAVKKIATLEGHEDRILALAISPNGALLATGGRDHTARLWDLRAAKELHVFPKLDQPVTAAVFAPDGGRLATGGFDNSIKLWNVENFERVAEWTMASNADPRLATSKKQAGQGLPPAGQVFPFDTASDGIVALDFSADGRSLASASTNWLIEVRDVTTGQVRSTLRDIKSQVRWVRFHRDGASLLVQAWGAPMTQWDVSTGQKLFAVSSVMRPPQAEFCRERNLVALSSGMRCDIWDLDAPVERAKFVTETVRGSVSVAVFGRDGDVLATGCGDRVFLWDVQTGELRKTLVGHKNHVSGLAFSPDGRMLASSSSTFMLATPAQETPQADDVRLWDVASGEMIGVIPIGVVKAPSLAFSPDGTKLVTSHLTEQEGESRRPILSIWDVKTRTLQFTLEPPDASFGMFGRELMQLAFNPADGALVSSTGRALCIWNLENRELRKKLLVGSEGPVPGAANEFLSMAISPDGTSIATVNTALPAGMELNVWDAKTGELRNRTRGITFRSVQFSPNGKNLVAVSGATVQIWDALTLQQRTAFEVHKRTGRIGLAVSPDGQTLATAVLPHDSSTINVLVEGPAEVKLWDVSRSPSLMTFQGQVTAKFSPDNKTLMETDRSGAIRLWDLESGRVRASFDTTQRRVGSVFSPDGRYLFGADVAGAAANRVRSGVRFQGYKVGDMTAVLSRLDTQTGAFREIEVGKGPMRAPVFSPDGKRLALVHDTSMGEGYEDRTSISVEIWNLDEEKAEATFPFPNVAVIGAAAFSADGRTLALPVNNDGEERRQTGRILLIDLARSAVLPALETETSGLIQTLRFTGDDARLVARSGNQETGSTTMWDWRAGKRLEEPIPEVFGGLDVSPDGRYELQRLPHGIELVDRTVRPPSVVSRRNP